MKGRLSLVCSLILLLMLSTPAHAAVIAGGEDVEPDISDSPIEKIEHSTGVADQSTWSINITLTDEAAHNNTSVGILMQMCTNEGVCYAPDWVEVENSTDNTLWNASWQTIDYHAYVNWKVSLSYGGGGSEDFPAQGYAKAWSSCWYDIASDMWGGPDCPDGENSTDVEPESEEGKDSIPAIGMLASLTLFGLAAMAHRRS